MYIPNDSMFNSYFDECINVPSLSSRKVDILWMEPILGVSLVPLAFKHVQMDSLHSEKIL